MAQPNLPVPSGADFTPVDLTTPDARLRRDALAARVDVLDKVGALRALPDDMHVTTEMVAEFYEVPTGTVRALVLDNRAELETDGYRVVTRSAFEVSYPKQLTSSASRIALFPRRAVLRVGMLLRDSAVARRVRDYLLDAEPVTPVMMPTGPELLAHAILEAQKMIAAKDAQIAQLDGKLAAAAPKLEYLDRHVAENDDVVTIEAWGHLYGLTEPKAFELLRGKDIIYRHLVGKRWSASKQRLVCEYEHLPYGDCIDWFSRRPQHDAPRHHNGQVRMTLYVKVFHSEDIARKAGLVGQMTLPEDQEGQP
ncbi:phage antirepressor KilAC domain-containing protein [Nocardia farcinica]|nr:phage antirepressor KilAC domain-containing protein [Nocardia farcinica]